MERSRKTQNCNSFTSSDRSTPTFGSAAASPSIASDANSGILNETVLVLVFRSINWDPHVICVAACVSRRLRAVASRVLFRELCISRAPRMVTALTAGGAAPGGRLGGGWHSLAKLLFFCCGFAAPTRFFALDRPTPGHFISISRFSKTSGRSFLVRRCWGDLLFVSDPCEHPEVGGVGEDLLGAYRGVFRGFMKSKTRAWLIGKKQELESRVRCPYCGARVWSMMAAGLVPKTASRRLGSHEGRLDYFVCVNGHLHGFCWLAHLSTDEERNNDEEGDDDDGGGGSGGDEAVDRDEEFVEDDDYDGNVAL